MGDWDGGYLQYSRRYRLAPMRSLKQVEAERPRKITGSSVNVCGRSAKVHVYVVDVCHGCVYTYCTMYAAVPKCCMEGEEKQKAPQPEMRPRHRT